MYRNVFSIGNKHCLFYMIFVTNHHATLWLQCFVESKDNHKTLEQPTR